MDEEAQVPLLGRQDVLGALQRVGGGRRVAPENILKKKESGKGKGKRVSSSCNSNIIKKW
jgi:hypothetical protein